MDFFKNPFKKEENTSQPTEVTPLAVKKKKNASSSATTISDHSKAIIEMVKDGPFTVHIFAFFGGFALFVTAIWDFIESFIEGNAGEILISFYSACLGCLIIIVEGRRLPLREGLITKIKFYLRIVDFAWGRGCIYLIAGSLQFTIQNKLNSYVGAYLILVGSLALFASFSAGRKLAEMRNKIHKENDLAKYFKRYDTDNNKSLNAKEFTLLVFDLGVDVSYYEAEACFNSIDKNDDERISYDEFYNWWAVWGKEQMYRNFGHGISDAMV